MASYQTFTTARTTEPDATMLFMQLRALDATAGVQHQVGSPTYTIKKATAWTAPQISAAQNAIDTAPAATPQLTAQSLIDSLSLVDKAIVLALIDQLNVLRQALPTPLPAITVPQALAAIRQKAGQL